MVDWDSDKLYNLFDKINHKFKENNEHSFCRCYSCVFPILYEKLCNRGEFDCVKNDFLKQLTQNINDEYLASADYRDFEGKKTGLKCGYGCVHYEERTEACPFAFWESRVMRKFESKV